MKHAVHYWPPYLVKDIAKLGTIHGGATERILFLTQRAVRAEAGSFNCIFCTGTTPRGNSGAGK